MAFSRIGAGKNKSGLNSSSSVDEITLNPRVIEKHDNTDAILPSDVKVKKSRNTEHTRNAISFGLGRRGIRKTTTSSESSNENVTDEYITMQHGRKENGDSKSSEEISSHTSKTEPELPNLTSGISLSKLTSNSESLFNDHTINESRRIQYSDSEYDDEEYVSSKTTDRDKTQCTDGTFVTTVSTSIKDESTQKAVIDTPIINFRSPVFTNVQGSDANEDIVLSKNSTMVRRVRRNTEVGILRKDIGNQNEINSNDCDERFIPQRSESVARDCRGTKHSTKISCNGLILQNVIDQFGDHISESTQQSLINLILEMVALHPHIIDGGTLFHKTKSLTFFVMLHYHINRFRDMDKQNWDVDTGERIGKSMSIGTFNWSVLCHDFNKVGVDISYLGNADMNVNNCKMLLRSMLRTFDKSIKDYYNNFMTELKYVPEFSDTIVVSILANISNVMESIQDIIHKQSNDPTINIITVINKLEKYMYTDLQDNIHESAYYLSLHEMMLYSSLASLLRRT